MDCFCLAGSILSNVSRSIIGFARVVGVNRIGTDSNNHEYIGHSQVVDYLGNYIQEPNENEEVFIVKLDKNELLETRKKLNFLNDKDEFVLL